MESDANVLKGLNELLKFNPAENNLLTRKVLFEKSINGREISPIFLKRIENFNGYGFKYIHSIFDKQETEMECVLIKLLKNFRIYATLKSNKRSLPYTNEIIVELPVESDMNAMWDYKTTFRKIVKELLDKNVFKIRFYVHVENYENPKNIFLNCGIRYRFRYFVH
jgi:hypothetical protein